MKVGVEEDDEEEDDTNGSREGTTALETGFVLLEDEESILLPRSPVLIIMSRVDHG